MVPVTYQAFSLLAVLSLTACARGTTGAERFASIHQNAGVYAALLNEVYGGALPDTLVVRDSTLAFRVPTGGRPVWRREFELIPAPLVESLASVSSERLLSASLGLPHPVRALSTDEQRALFREGPSIGWEQFHRQFPNARMIFGISPIAFNADSTQALVYYEYHCGSLCGGGKVAWFTRESGTWTLRRTVTFWVS